MYLYLYNTMHDGNLRQGGCQQSLKKPPISNWEMFSETSNYFVYFVVFLSLNFLSQAE